MDWGPAFERIAKAALEEGIRVDHARALALGAPPRHAVGVDAVLVEPRFTLAFVAWLLQGGWRRPGIAPQVLVERLAALLGECDSSWDLPAGMREPDWEPLLQRFEAEAGAVDPAFPLLAQAWRDITRERLPRR